MQVVLLKTTPGKVRDRHWRQMEDPGELLKRPLPQGLQEVVPSEEVPAGQTVQLPSALRPLPGEQVVGAGQEELASVVAVGQERQEVEELPGA